MRYGEPIAPADRPSRPRAGTMRDAVTVCIRQVACSMGRGKQGPEHALLRELGSEHARLLLRVPSRLHEGPVCGHDGSYQRLHGERDDDGRDRRVVAGCPRPTAESLRKGVENHLPTSSSGRKANKLPLGVCTLRVKKSTRLLQHIYGAIQEYGGFDEPRWLDGPPRKPQRDRR